MTRAQRLLARRKAAEERDERRRRWNALVLEIVSAGYRAVAAKHHPDRSGDAATFIHVGQVRDSILRMTMLRVKPKAMPSHRSRPRERYSLR